MPESQVQASSYPSRVIARSLISDFKNLTWQIALLFVALAGVFLVAAYIVAPVGVDWEQTFHPATRSLADPYTNSKFTNPPWALFFLPHAIFDLRFSNAVNLLLNATVLLLIIRRFGGSMVTILLVFTTPHFLDLMRTNNIDWIPALALLVPPAYGMALLAVKPQAIGAVVLIWWRDNNFRPYIFIPTAILLGLSFLVYGFWFNQAAGVPEISAVWNLAPFPFLIPVGAYLLYRAYRTENSDDAIALSVTATIFLTPYVAFYSVNTVIALLASRFKREAFIIWCMTWINTIYFSRIAIQVASDLSPT